MKKEKGEVYMSLSVSDFNSKITKAEKEIDVLQEKINKKKKEIANLKKQKHVQELKERTKRNEKLVSALEEKIGGDISEDMIDRFVEFQKMNSENNNSEIEKYQNENCNTDKTDSYY